MSQKVEMDYVNFVQSVHTAGSHRKPIVGPRYTVTMGNDLSAEISATRRARGLKFGPHATHASMALVSTPPIVSRSSQAC